MILTAYIDESGTHSGSPITVMGGTLGTANQLRKFEIDFSRIQKEGGFTVLHAKNLIKERPEKFLAVSDMVLSSIYKNSIHGFVVNIDNDAFTTQYRSGDHPKKLRLDTAYGLCLRFCLWQIISEVSRREFHHRKFNESQVHIVMESGHKHAGDAARVFEEVRKELAADGNDLLASLTFAPKETCGAIMAADMIAHISYAVDVARRAGRISPRDPSKFKEKGPGIMHLLASADALASLKQGLVNNFNKRRGAVKVSSPSDAPLMPLVETQLS